MTTETRIERKSGRSHPLSRTLPQLAAGGLRKFHVGKSARLPLYVVGQRH